MWGDVVGLIARNADNGLPSIKDPWPVKDVSWPVTVTIGFGVDDVLDCLRFHCRYRHVGGSARMASLAGSVHVLSDQGLPKG